MFIVELFNVNEGFGYCVRHKVYKANALTLRQAMHEALGVHPGWHVAQVRRSFADCKLPQPVYDAHNTLMFPEVLVDNPLSTWSDLMAAGPIVDDILSCRTHWLSQSPQPSGT